MVSEKPVARVVILGASNVARGIGTLVEVARATFGSPVEVIAAMGHGRSYGITTSIPFRTLPSILESGLWQALERRPNLPTWTILTDVGNDVLYGCSVEQIMGWVEECLKRLQPLSETVLLTGLPLASVRNLGPWRFYSFRRVLFRRSTLQLPAALLIAEELDLALRALAQKHAARLLLPEPTWYGIDPIHIRFQIQRAAWEAMFHALMQPSASFSQPEIELLEQSVELIAKKFSTSSVPRVSWNEWWRILTMRPDQSVVMQQVREVPQPAVTLRDGSTVSFF